jgi:hypothetical protein
MTSALRSAPDDLERNHRRIDSSSLQWLPVVLSHPVVTAVDTSAVLVSLPGRVIDPVTAAEQTFTAPRAVVAQTDALLERVEHVADTAEDVIQQVAPGVDQLLDLASQLGHVATRRPKVFRRPHHQPS